MSDPMDLSAKTGRAKAGLKERVKDLKPPPILLIKDNQRLNHTLTTPDIQKSALQTPDLKKLLYQNHQEPKLAQGDGANFGLSDISSNIKEEIESNPPSVDTSISSDKTEDITSELTGSNRTNMNETDELNPMDLANALAINGQEAVMTGSIARVNSALPTVPVDMSRQEAEKVERKRQRNRVAATKCRKRKIERITILEQEVKELNENLQAKLKEKRELEIEVEEIRNRIKIHIKQGCPGLDEYLLD